MNWIKENWFKVSISLAVILIGISASYYYVYFLPHKEQVRVEEERAKTLREQVVKDELAEQNKEQDKKEYTAKRKKDCYDILERERKMFNNTKDAEYDTETDVCRIIYKAVQGEWRGQDCEKLKPSGALADNPYFWKQYWNCKEGIFDKEY